MNMNPSTGSVVEMSVMGGRGGGHDDDDLEAGVALVGKGAELGTSKPFLGSTLPPRWVDVVEKVHGHIELIQTRMVQLKEAHRKVLLPGFDDRAEDEAAIGVLTRAITKEFDQAAKGIASLAPKRKTAQLVKEAEELTIRRNAQSSLALKLQSVSEEFRGAQTRYMRQLEQRKSGGGTLDRLGSIGLDDGEDALDASNLRLGMSDEQQQLVAVREAELGQRSKEIDDLAEDIEGLALLFRDLNALVVDQGTILDNIAANLEATAVHTEQAYEENVKAHKYAAKHTRRLIILLLIFITIAMFIIYMTIRKNKRANPQPTPTPDPGDGTDEVVSRLLLW